MQVPTIDRTIWAALSAAARYKAWESYLVRNPECRGKWNHRVFLAWCDRIGYTFDVTTGRGKFSKARSSTAVATSSDVPRRLTDAILRSLPVTVSDLIESSNNLSQGRAYCDQVKSPLGSSWLGKCQPLFNVCVARPVGKAEIARQPKAQKAMEAECTRIRDKHVWDESNPREWDDVRREATRKGEDIHMGYLFLNLRREEFQVGT